MIKRDDLAEYNRTKKKKYNNYDLSGEYGIGWTTNKNTEFYFDLEDYNKIKDYCWIEHVTTNGYRALEARVPGENKHIRFHQLLGMKGYDHINRNPLDNRKENLRKASYQENCRNRTKQSNNTTGVVGVYLCNKTKKWLAKLNKERLYYGESFEEAVIARLRAEKKCYGEFAPQRHLYEQYGIV